jgi:branched-chain amino acid transport system permease protein
MGLLRSAVIDVGQPIRRAARGRLIHYAVLIVALAVLPVIFEMVGGGLFTLSNLIVMGLYALPAVGLVLLMGYAGQISIGQAAFYACGGYTSAVLATTYGVPTVPALVVGALIAAAIAWVVGLALFRTRGHYLAIATLAFGLIVANIVGQLDVTGGQTGISGIPKLNFGFVRLNSDLDYYGLIAVLLLIAILLSDNLVRSNAGRAFRAVGDSEVGAASSGVRIRRQKLVVFVTSAVLASVSGSVYASWTSFVDPSGTAGLLISLQILVIATLGGLRSVWGAPVGAFVVVALSQLSRTTLPDIFPNAGGQIQILVYGVVLAAVLIFLPDGLAGGFGRLWRALPFSRTAPAPPPTAENAGVVEPGSRRTMPQTSTGTSQPLLQASAVSRAFGGVLAVDAVDLTIPGGGIVGLIGPNGAGKTTLLNMLSGTISPSAGTIRVSGQSVAGDSPDTFARLGVMRTFQNLQLFESLSVAENVLVSQEAHADPGVFAAFVALPSRRAEERAMRERADEALRRLGIEGFRSLPVSGLSHGDRRKVEIARALAASPRLLLLDEPMAGLSHAESDQLAQVITAAADEGVTVVLVEHYIPLVMQLSKRVVALHQGRVLRDGTPREVQSDAAVIQAVLGTGDESEGVAAGAEAGIG